MNRGVVYGLWDYEVEAEDELSFREGDCMTILRREDQEETQWWWARCGDKEGYIPRNLLGVSLSVCVCVCVDLSVCVHVQVCDKKFIVKPYNCHKCVSVLVSSS